MEKCRLYFVKGSIRGTDFDFSTRSDSFKKLIYLLMLEHKVLRVREIFGKKDFDFTVRAQGSNRIHKYKVVK